MGIDWEFLKTSNDDIETWSKEDFEDVFQNLSSISAMRSRDRTVEKLELLFNLSQKIMIAKWNQVPALEKELMKLAESAGRMDAHREQELLDEIDRLNQMLESSPSSKVSKIDDDSAFPYDWSREWKAKKQELEEKLIHKNLEIEQLIENLAGEESQKSRLENDVTNLQSQLSLATTEINSIASECQSLKRILATSNENASTLQAKIASLESRNQELKLMKSEQEEKYTEFQSEVDERVEKLADVIKEKDKEILNLKSEARKYEHLGDSLYRDKSIRDTSDDVVNKLNQTLEKREEEIQILTQNLEKATKEIDKDAELISTLKRSRRSVEIAESAEIMKVRSELHEASNHIKRLERQLGAAEDDAQIHAHDLSTVLSELKSYMRGDYSLAEAVADLKETRKQLRLRDSEIEEFTSLTNELNINVNSLLDENMELREQMNLEPREDINLIGVKTTNWRNSKQAIQKMTTDIYKLQEEKRSLRATIFEMTRHISDLKHALQCTNSRLTDEVDPLPNETIRDQISQLHTAVMRLFQQQQGDEQSKEKLNLLKEKCLRLEGENIALERALRDEDEEEGLPSLKELQETDTVTLMDRRNMKKLKKVMKKLPLSTEESLARLKSQVKFLLEETSKKESRVIEGKSHLSAYKSQFEALLSEVSQLNEKMNAETQKWEEIVSKLEESESDYAAKKVALESQVTELKIYIEECNVNCDEAANKLAIRSAESKYEFELSQRMIKVHRKEIDLLRERKSVDKDNQISYCKKIKELHNELILTTERDNQLISRLRNRLNDSVSASCYNAIHTDLVIITSKYRAALSNRLLEKGEKLEQEVAKSTIEDLKKVHENMEDQLIEAKEKIYSLQNSLSMVTANDPGMINTKIDLLSKQLAAVEQRELSALQKADHAVKKYENSQRSCSEATRRLREVEDSHRKLIAVNLSLQEKEVRLEHQVASYSSDIIQKLNGEILELTKQAGEARLETRRVEMLLRVYETQLNHFKQRCQSTESELNQIRRMQEDLASLNEENANIAILRMELSEEKAMNYEIKTELEETKVCLEETSLALSQSKFQMEENEKEIRRQNSNQKSTNERLLIIIKDLRLQFAGAVPLPELEKMTILVEELQQEKRCLQSNLQMAKKDRRGARLLLQEMKVKQETLDDVLDALNSSSAVSSRSVAEWSKKLEEVRLKNVHLKEKLITLEEEETVNRSLLEAKENRCEELQDQLSNLETLWVEQQKSWEQQLWMKEFVNPPSAVEKITSESSTRSTSIDNISVYESKLKLKDQEIAVLQEKVQSLTHRQMTLESEVQRLREERFNQESPKTPPVLQEEKFNIIISGLKERITLSEEALTVSRTSFQQYHNELQEKNVRFKSEISLLLAAKAELERKVLNLQAELDDIPTRSNNGYKISAQQMEIETLQASKISLEKRLERSKQERRSLEESIGQLERNFAISKREKIEEKQHLEVSFEVKTQQMNREFERLSKQVRELQEERDHLLTEIKNMQDGAIRSPSLILKTLVEKLRDQLIVKEKQICSMKKEFLELQEQLNQTEREEKDDSELHRPERDFENTFQFPEVSKPTTEIEVKSQREKEKVENDLAIQKLTVANKAMKQKLQEKEVEVNTFLLTKEHFEDQISALKEKADPSRTRKLQKEISELKLVNKTLSNQIKDLTGDTPESIYRNMDYLQNKLLKLADENFLEGKRNREKEIEIESKKWDDRKKFEMNLKKLREKNLELTNSLQRADENLKTCNKLLNKYNREKFQLKTKITKLNKAITENLCGVCFRGFNANDLNRTYTIEPTPVEVAHVEECSKCNKWAKDNNHLEVRLKDCIIKRKKLQDEKDDVERRFAEAMEEIVATRHLNERLKENLKALQEGKSLIVRPSSAAIPLTRGRGVSATRPSGVPESGAVFFKFNKRTPSELAGTTVVLNYEETIADLEEEIRQKTHLLTYTKNVLENAKVREEALLKEQQKLRVRISILQSVRDDTEQANLVAELREAKVTIYRLHEELQSRSDS